ncbi:hypothetical protein SK3146_02304 [Paenibacillus konkukensis]|uniref:Sporulation membrane protein YtrI C-terminal domain-containing protein n=1 Tax=Paenibacillus konkukensis TaxID=2020716 RepID=A0ABY4RNK8_9BACL|nr:hypothetical protein [Paenibacillus konkukensis]UQZ83143.1 hypothetical protein SK3146_02304 [Paenibacillus konkukensis]
MRVPPFEYYTGLLKATGLLIAGIIIGSALFMSIYHQHLNDALVDNRELRAKIEKLEQDNDSFKKTRNQQSVINSIDIVVEPGDLNPLDKVTEQEIERRVRSDLSVIKGQKIATFAETPHVYQRLLSQKTYHGILDKDYTVSLKTMLLIQNELRVWVTAKEFKRSTM